MDIDDNLIVLVHDAWHGAWAWDGVIAHLEQREYSAVALDLPGYGTSPAPKQLTFQDYANAVKEFIASTGAAKVLLVGHGMSGPVLQLVAEQLGQEQQAQISGLIFVGAYILQDGESILEVMPPEMATYFRQMATLNPQNLISLAEMPEYWYYNVVNDDQSQAEELLGKMTPAPLAPMEEKIKLTTFFNQHPPAGFISFNEDLTLPPGDFYPRQANRLGKPKHMPVNAGHEGPVTKPREVAEAILFMANSL